MQDHLTLCPESKFHTLLTSRKFWAALVGLVLVILKACWPDLPVEEEQITDISYVLAAYILGTAIEQRGAQ